MDGDVVFDPNDQRLTGTSVSLGAAPAPSRRLGRAAHAPAPAQDQQNHPILSWLVKWLDAAAVVAAALAASWIGGHFLPPARLAQQTLPDLAGVFAFFMLSRPARLPLPRLPALVTQQLRIIAPALVLAGLAQACLFWWQGWSAGMVLRDTGTWMALTAAGLVTARALSGYALRHPAIEKRLTRKIAIIGYDVHALRIAERLANAAQHGVPQSMNVAGIFADAADCVAGGGEAGLEAAAPGAAMVAGTVDDLIRLSEQTELGGIIIALPPAHGHEGGIQELAWRLRNVAADVFVMPYLIHGPEILLPVQTIASMPFMVLQRRPLDEWQAFCKKIFDVVVSLVALPPFLLIFILVAIAIKLDSPGPVLFRQPRRGFNNRQFMVLKFRSMHHAAADLQALKQTSRGDARVTRVGKWLRQLSIDELPQLLNVLRGEMSLVGPRPHAPHMRVEGELLDQVIVEYFMRYKVKPGITGWAQVNGARGQLVKSDDLRRRLSFDLEYIQRWSIGFDLKIMALTVAREIISNHAF